VQHQPSERDGAADRHIFCDCGEGNLIGLGSGDPSDHQSCKENSRRAFNGLVRAEIQSPKVAGMIKVAASAPGLTLTPATTVNIPTLPSRQVPPSCCLICLQYGVSPRNSDSQLHSTISIQ
jgi:hypothetical protein